MKTFKAGRLALSLAASAAALMFAAASRAQSASQLALMPMPAQVALGEGQMPIDGNFTVALAGPADARLAAAEHRFLHVLWRETGIPMHSLASGSTASLTVTIAGSAEATPTLGEDESYHLEVAAGHAQLTAANALGAMHGLQTFLQLVEITPQGFAVPAVTIDDKPRFPWRGLMIDAGRHFMPVEVIERNLDGMEAVKMNVLHWHLSEDQGFPIESKVFPLLEERGSNGHFYTQQQVSDIIAYARDRGIRVVPEFDMPCHTSALLAAYPQLGSGPGPYQIATKWGVFDAAMDPTQESTYDFIDRFLGEMTALFPDAYFHIGGDECNGKEWDANSRIKQFMREHGLKDNAALQSYFTGRVQKLVTAHNKITVGWDEVLQPDTPKDVVIQSWRGQKALAAATRKGNRGLLSNGYYIDLNQSAAEHYLADPLGGDGASLSDEEKARVLGGEATMWSEYTTAENVDSRIWPRTAAIAERLWSLQDVRDVDSMYARLAIASQKLRYYGLQHESFTEAMLERMSGQTDPEALKVLALVVQPPLGYQREELKDYGTSSPLNRLVDAVPPESETAREFGELAKKIAAGKATAAERQQARAWLTAWRDNDAKLEPTLGASELTAELVPVSQTLAHAATMGLEALDDIENHHTMSEATAAADKSALKAAEKPQAVLRDMVVPGVEALVRAASAR